MKNLTHEMIAKAKAAKSAEELMALAKENNVELTEEEAKTYFEQLNASGTVTDDELDMVAGGACSGDDEESGEEQEKPNNNPCSRCGGRTVPMANAMKKCLTCGHVEKRDLESSMKY